MALQPSWSQEAAGEPLTRGEMEGLVAQIQRCWMLPSDGPAAAIPRVSVKVKLDRNGDLDGLPEIVSEGAEDVIAASAKRAVMRCAPYDLPAGKYPGWAELIINFDPGEMF